MKENSQAADWTFGKAGGIRVSINVEAEKCWNEDQKARWACLKAAGFTAAAMTHRSDEVMSAADVMLLARYIETGEHVDPYLMQQFDEDVKKANERVRSAFRT
jgi:hypothetical protein